MNGWRKYLVLVIGAQAVPGLWVVLSVPATEREGGKVRVSWKLGPWNLK